MTKASRGRVDMLSSLRASDGKGIVRIEHRLETGIDGVWSALTEPARLARWLGDFTGELRLGSGFRARLFASEWQGTGSVEACDAPQRLVVTMTEAGATDPDVTEVRLGVDGESTAFVVEQRGLPRDQLAAYGAGLQIHVEDLAAYLGGGDRCDARARWKELRPSYEAKALDLA